MVDDIDIFNGVFDCYNWIYEGKWEIYIFYNNYEIVQQGVLYFEIFGMIYLNLDFMCWELYCVYVVMVIFKEGECYIYVKCWFYVDEDSWNMVLLDQYDGCGEFWCVSMGVFKNYYELLGIWIVFEVFYDLQVCCYYVQGLDIEEQGIMVFIDEVLNKCYFFLVLLCCWSVC